jgi:tetratricopeptide (TPR) repeat protein/ADP-heptose:LPS heptosyltransferase
MFPQRVQPPRVACKCCAAAADLYDVCDLSKSCEEARGARLPLAGIPVYYYRCSQCGFLFTTDFDGATAEEFKRHVYNEGYAAVDPDYTLVRPRANAHLVAGLFRPSRTAIRVLDYGGGNGVLEQTLRQDGFAAVTTYDPFTEAFSEQPAGPFHLVTAFEVIEHVSNPYETFERMASLLDPENGLLLFSTLLQPGDIDQTRARWWYLAPRNGHVSLHTARSLAVVLGKLGFTLKSPSTGLHFAFRTVPAFARHLLSEVSQPTMSQDPANAEPVVSQSASLERAAGPAPSATLVTAAPAPAAAVEGTPRPGEPEGTPEELHNRALTFINEGKPDQALPLLRRAVELQPDNPDYHHNLGVALAHRNELDAAVACFREALRLKPEGTSALSNMGLALAQQGKLDEAVTAFQDCLRIQPGAVDVLHRVANVLRAAKKPADAVPYLQQAVSLSPQSADLHHSLGLALADLGRNDDAIAAYREALRIDPKYADALNNLGIILQNVGKADEAIDCYRRALRVRPHSSETYNNLGVALAAKELHEDAITAYRAALQLFPDSAAAYSNLGNAFRQIGLVEDAIVALDRALQLNPNYAEGYNNKAVAMVQAGDPAEAIACYTRALELKPDYPDAYLNRALARILIGDYDQGLDDYEWRWRRPGRGMPDWGRPVWDGSDPVGRTILLWGEQGLGDTLQYCRYAAVLARRGATPLLCVPEPLVRLLRTVPGVAQVASSSDKLPPYACHAPLMSLPKLCGMRRLEDAPGPVPYLAADPQAAAAGRDRVRAGAPLVVGCVWRGNPGYAGDRIRSVPAAAFAALAKVPGVRLVSLMKEGAAEELAAAGAEDVGAAGWADFADTAAAVANLDLVVSVDTAAAHLAGALGVPLWLALPSAPDWRWGLARPDSPWYPAARLFRQARRGDWDPVLLRLAHELEIVARRGIRPADTVGVSSVADVLQGRGLDLLRDGRLEDATAHLEEAVGLKGDSAAIRINLGVALAQQRRLGDAIRHFREAVALDPDSALGLANLGLAYVQSDRYAEAAEVLEKAARLDPSSADVHNHLGISLAQLGREDEAARCYARAIELRPDYHPPHTNLGNLLRSQGQLEEALACYEKAIQLCPADPEIYNNRGITYDGMQEPDRAMADYDQALALNPEHVETRFNRALALLLQGDYERGLEEYEWRWRRPGRGMPDWGVPLFDGSVVPGKTVLVWPEQGLGDVIHCCRFAALLGERGMRVLLRAPQPLVRLLRTLRGVAGVYGPDEPVSGFDCHAPLMSLPKLVGMRRLEDAPGPVPYLAADPQAAAAGRDRVRAGAPLVVGCVWRGNPGYAGDRIRSVPAAAFAALAKVPGVRLVSLMKEGAAEELAAAGAEDVGAAGWADFADTAAAVANLDLVVSVDTAAAHLAGALGVPLWLALPSAPDWRWGLARPDSPWYPAARLFRQARRGDWDPVLLRLAHELAAQAEGGGALGPVLAEVV